MSYETYEEFEDNLGNILSSGGCGEVSDFHEESITELVSGMDRDSVVDFFNIFYTDQDPSELREGELSLISEIVSDLDKSRDEVEVSAQIIFK